MEINDLLKDGCETNYEIEDYPNQSTIGTDILILLGDGMALSQPYLSVTALSVTAQYSRSNIVVSSLLHELEFYRLNI